MASGVTALRPRTLSRAAFLYGLYVADACGLLAVKLGFSGANTPLVECVSKWSLLSEEEVREEIAAVLAEGFGPTGRPLSAEPLIMRH